MAQLIIPPNPFTVGTSDHVDFTIWEAGVDQFNTNPYIKKQAPPPHELDYLRGFHRLSVLQAMQAYLIAALGRSSAVRITSLWLDKFAWAYPHQTIYTKRRELADLAVIIRVNNSATWMWLLQGKKMPSPYHALPSDLSTKKEIELMTGNLSFDLNAVIKGPTSARHSTVRVPILISADFGPPRATFNHWSFLSFFEDPSTYNNQNPCQWMWPAPLNAGSLTEQLKNLCLKAAGRRTTAFGEDASKSGPNPHWTLLHDTLMQNVVIKPTSGYAGGATSINAFSAQGSGFDALKLMTAARIYNQRFGEDSLFFTPFQDQGFDWQCFSTGFATTRNGWLNMMPEYRAFQARSLRMEGFEDPTYERPTPWPDSYLRRQDETPPDKANGDGGNTPPRDDGDDGDDDGTGVPLQIIIEVLEAGSAIG